MIATDISAVASLRKEQGEKTPVIVYNDPVNHPSHYTSGKYEVIDIIEDQLGLDGLRGFCLGNAIKYICRAGKKNKDKTIEDLKKAIWYIERYCKQAQGKEVE